MYKDCLNPDIDQKTKRRLQILTFYFLDFLFLLRWKKDYRSVLSQSKIVTGQLAVSGGHRGLLEWLTWGFHIYDVAYVSRLVPSSKQLYKYLLFLSEFQRHLFYYYLFYFLNIINYIIMTLGLRLYKGLENVISRSTVIGWWLTTKVILLLNRLATFTLFNL